MAAKEYLIKAQGASMTKPCTLLDQAQGASVEVKVVVDEGGDEEIAAGSSNAGSSMGLRQ